MKKFRTGLILTVLLCLTMSGYKQESDIVEPVKFYSPQKGIYIVDIDIKACPDCISPYVSNSLETVESVGEKTDSLASINAGFFDPNNCKTTSYVYKNGELVADPNLNTQLINNAGIQKYLPQILNRSEFRILSCLKDQKVFDIAQHNSPIRQGCKIEHSIQAGPELVPTLKLEEEAFIVKKDNKIIRQSAGALGKYARSAIGIKGNHVLLVAVGNQNPMSLPELAGFMKSLKVDKAMAFDGGSSTSLYVKQHDGKKFILNSAKEDSARRVKSILTVKLNYTNLKK